MFLVLFASLLSLVAGCFSVVDGLLTGGTANIRQRRGIQVTLFSLSAIGFLLFLLLQILFP